MRKVLLIFLVSALVLGLTGCGKKDSKEDKLKEAISKLNEDVFSEIEELNDIEESSNIEESSDIVETNDDPVEILESEDSKTNEGIVFGDYIIFESASNVLETFAEFGYEYITKNAGEEPSTWSFQYKYLGSESIDGVETGHYQITMLEDGETKLSEGWYDNSWTAVKFLDSYGEQTGDNASWAGSTLTMMTQMYCNQMSINLAIYSEDGGLDEFAYEKLENEHKDMEFGYGNTDVEIVNVKSKFADLIMRSGAAKLNDKRFYVIFETEISDGSLQGLYITNAIVR